jgi:hypothetical protein
LHGQQCIVPAALQLAGDKAIGRIDRVVLAMGVGSLISRLLKRQLELSLRGRYLVRLGLDRLGGGVNAERLQNAQHLSGDGAVDARAADRDATRRAVVHASAIATVAAEFAAVGDMQLAAAVATTQESGQQEFTAAHRSLDRGAAFASCVFCEFAG